MELMQRYLRCAVALALVSAGPLTAQAPRYDVVIHGGRVVDGTGAPWYAADIAVSDGRIVAIGRIDRSSRQPEVGHGDIG